MTTKYEAIHAALELMVAEFKEYDLPYGSKAYLQATTALNMPEDEPVAVVDPQLPLDDFLEQFYDLGMWTKLYASPQPPKK